MPALFMTSQTRSKWQAASMAIFLAVERRHFLIFLFNKLDHKSTEKFQGVILFLNSLILVMIDPFRELHVLCVPSLVNF